jgi:hypothetical protein
MAMQARIALMTSFHLSNHKIGLDRPTTMGKTGWIFRTVDDVRQAVKTFVDLCNSEWRVRKNGFRSPHEISQAA